MDASESLPAPPVRRRWRFQYRLRTLLGLMTLLAVLLGLFSGPLVRWRRERAAVEKIERVIARKSVPPFGFRPQPGIAYDLDTAFGSGLFSRVLGEAIYQRVTAIDLHRCEVFDADLEDLAAFSQLRSLNLNETKITDTGLQSLRRLKCLVRLHVGCTAVSYEALAQLQDDLPAAKNLVGQRVVDEMWLFSGDPALDCKSPEEISVLHWDSLLFDRVAISLLHHLPGLRGLRVAEAAYTSLIRDEDLQHLAILTSLEELVLLDAQISDQGLQRIESLTRLKRLQLSGEGVSGESFQLIAKFRDLESLELGIEAVYDQDLVHLAGLLKLRELRLPRARLSGRGLKHLTGLPKLESLLLPSDIADPLAVERLRLALPKVEITIAKNERRCRDPAEYAYVRHDYPRMIRHLERWAESPQRDPGGLAWLGHAYRLAGNPRNAAEAYGRCLKEMDQNPRRSDQMTATYYQDFFLPPSRAEVNLLLAEVQFYELNDPAAAVATLTDNNRVQHPIPHGLGTERLLATAYRRQAKVAASLECWVRVATTTYPLPEDCPPEVARAAGLIREQRMAPSQLYILTDERPEIAVDPRGPIDGPILRLQEGNEGGVKFAVLAPPGRRFAALECTTVADDPSAVVSCCYGPYLLTRSVAVRERQPTGTFRARVEFHPAARGAAHKPAEARGDSILIEVDPAAPGIVWFWLPEVDGRQHVSELRLRATLIPDELARPVAESAKPGKPEASGPLEIAPVELPGFVHVDLREAALVVLPDEHLFMAFTPRLERPWRKMMLSASHDAKCWVRPWAFEHNNTFDFAGPLLVVKDGEVCMSYGTNPVDLDVLTTEEGHSPYILWRSCSRDGGQWTQPDFQRTNASRVDWSPEVFGNAIERSEQIRRRKLEDLAGGGASSTLFGLLTRHCGRVSDSEVFRLVRDHQGGRYIVFLDEDACPSYFVDDLARPLEMQIFSVRKGSVVKFIVDNDRAVFLYATPPSVPPLQESCKLEPGGVFLRAVHFLPAGPKVGKEVHLPGIRWQDFGQCLVLHSGRIYMPLGGRGPRMLQGDFEKVFRASLPGMER